jgi:uncharacterized membrane protein YhaH (DUF805 family)
VSPTTERRVVEDYRAAIRFGLSKLVVVAGRDPVGQFWRFASAVVAVLLVLSPIAQVPLMVEVFGTFTTSEKPSFSASMFAPFLVLSLLAIGVLASAVCRRLHDTGLSGLWGATPLLPLAISVAAMAAMLSNADESEGATLAPFWIGGIATVVYLCSLVGLVALLARPSQCGSNRYGPEPDSPLA